MKVKDLTKTSLFGCLQFLVFYLFSDILYLEMITITTVLIALVFPRKQSVYGSIVFGVLNILLKQGLTSWSIMYLLIYPTYSLITSFIKNKKLRNNIYFIAFIAFFFSFMTGQLVQLPYMLVAKNITYIYILIGLKTSIIQASITGIITLFLYKPLYKTLKKIEGKKT